MFSFVAFALILSPVVLAADNAQETFSALKDEAAVMRDTCLKTTATKLDDLQEREKGKEVPENVLCFFKCFYEESGILKDGKYDEQFIDEVPQLQILKEKAPEVLERVKKCFKELPPVQTCQDFKNAQKCFS